MVPPVDVNWPAVLAATLVPMLVGSLWYGPLFGKRWAKAMGWNPDEPMTPERRAAGNRSMLLMVPVAFLGAYVLAHFIDYSASVSWLDGMQCGFWVWLGFQLPMVVQGRVFEGKRNELLWINGGYQLVALLLQGGLLALWA